MSEQLFNGLSRSTEAWEILGVSQAIPVSLWLFAALLSSILAAFRRRAYPYLPAAAFMALMGLRGFSGINHLSPLWYQAIGTLAAAFPAWMLARIVSGRKAVAAVSAVIPLATAALYLYGKPWSSAAALAEMAIFSLGLSALAMIRAREHRIRAALLVPGFVAMAMAPIGVYMHSFAYAMFDGLGSIALGLGMLLSAMGELVRQKPLPPVLDDRVARMSASMGRFIPAEFLDELRKGTVEDLKLGDHIKKEMTIFFSDIRSFTSLSESLTPEESFAFINSYLSRVVPLVTAHNGFVDKYMGDAIMALYAKENGADDAVASAIDMQLKMIEYNGHRAKMDYKPISMGIGIHTGTLMLGVVGVDGRMEGTVISDSVNLASRLQSIAKAFNIPLVISESTFMALQDPGRFKYRFIGKVRVKGKSAPVSAFEIFNGLPDEEFERKMQGNTFFEQGILAYYRKEFTDGIFYFNRALELVPNDGAARFYLETCLRKSMTSQKA